MCAGPKKFPVSLLKVLPFGEQEAAPLKLLAAVMQITAKTTSSSSSSSVSG
jgi:hypothetical protein